MASSYRSRAAHFSLPVRNVANRRNRDKNRATTDPPIGTEGGRRARNAGTAQIGPSPNQPQQPLDEETRQLAKGYFKLIQAVHHKNVIDRAISAQAPPKGMAKHVLKLTAFIKPSSPTVEVRQALANNTHNWMHNNLSILQDHYLQTILTHNSLPYNRIAFSVATNWARKRYRARLAHSTVQTAQSLLECHSEPSHVSESLQSSSVGSPLVVGGTPPRADLGDEGEFPPLPKPQATMLNSRSLYMGPKTPLVQQIVDINNRLVCVGGEEPVVRSKTSTLVHTQSTPRSDCRDLTPSAGRIQTERPPLALSPIVQIKRSTGTNSTLVPPRVRSHLSPSASGPPRPPPPPPPPPSSRQAQRQVSRVREEGPLFSSSDEDFVDPRPGRKRRPTTGNRSEGQIKKVSQLIQNIPAKNRSLQLPKPHLSNVAVLNDELPFDLAASNPSADSAGRATGPGPGSNPKPGAVSGSHVQKEVVGTQMMRQRSPKHNNADLQNENTFSDPNTKTTSGEPTPMGSPVPTNKASCLLEGEGKTQSRTGGQTQAAFVPTYHKARPGRKLVDWSFEGRKPIWFIGDSNLNRIPSFHNQDIQVDSYPGASFYHFWQLMERTAAHPLVKVVVLSVGMNNKDQDPKKTSIKQLRLLYNKARSVFPNACLYFPMINYSPLLPREQQEHLEKINLFISSRLPFLQPLPDHLFHTAADNVHWTQTTARNMFEHWGTQLQINL